MVCDCGKEKQFLVFPCSGAADTGEITDRVARMLGKSGAAKMYCLAGIGAGMESFIQVASDSTGVLALDGCPQDCAKKTLESHGVPVSGHMRITDEGMPKGQSPATEERVSAIARKAHEMLQKIRESTHA